MSLSLVAVLSGLAVSAQVADPPIRAAGVEIAKDPVDAALELLNATDGVDFAPYEFWGSGTALRLAIRQEREVAITARSLSDVDYERQGCQGRELGVECCRGVLIGPGKDGIQWGVDTVVFYVNRNHPLRANAGSVTPAKLRTILKGYLHPTGGLNPSRATWGQVFSEIDAGDVIADQPITLVMGADGSDDRMLLEQVSGVDLSAVPGSGGVGRQRTVVDKDRTKMGLYSIQQLIGDSRFGSNAFLQYDGMSYDTEDYALRRPLRAYAKTTPGEGQGSCSGPSTRECQHAQLLLRSLNSIAGNVTMEDDKLLPINTTLQEAQSATIDAMCGDGGAPTLPPSPSQPGTTASPAMIPATTSPVTGPPSDSEYCTITTRLRSGRVFDCSGGIASNLILEDNKGTDEQLWRYATDSGHLVCKGAGNSVALDAIEGQRAAGKLRLQEKYPGQDQLWRLEPVGDGSGYFSIINQLSGLAVDVENFNDASGVELLLWRSNEGTNQQWKMECA